MSYAETICDARSRRILEKGRSVWLGFYRYPNGAKWLARHRGRFYYIIHDGTGNQFFCSHAPREITENEAKKILLETLKDEELEEALNELGLEIREDEVDELLEL